MSTFDICLLTYLAIGAGFAVWLWIMGLFVERYLRIDTFGFVLIALIWPLLVAIWIYEGLS